MLHCFILEFGAREASPGESSSRIHNMGGGIFFEFSHAIKSHLRFVVETRKNLNQGTFPRMERSPNLSANGPFHGPV